MNHYGLKPVENRYPLSTKEFNAILIDLFEKNCPEEYYERKVENLLKKYRTQDERATIIRKLRQKYNPTTKSKEPKEQSIISTSSEKQNTSQEHTAEGETSSEMMAQKASRSSIVLTDSIPPEPASHSSTPTYTMSFADVVDMIDSGEIASENDETQETSVKSETNITVEDEFSDSGESKENDDSHISSMSRDPNDINERKWTVASVASLDNNS